MAQYFTDFTEYALGVLPSDWSEVEGSGFLTKASDGLYANARSTLRAGLWSAVSGTDFDVLARVKIASTLANSASAPVQGITARASSDGSNYYVFGIYSSSQVRLRKKTGGPTTITSATVATMAIDAWYWVRLQVIGTTIRGRVWADGASEPSGWDISVTDTAISSPGAAGVSCGTVTSADSTYSQFGVGTDGDPAPTGPVGGERQRSRLILTPW